VSRQAPARRAVATLLTTGLVMVAGLLMVTPSPAAPGDGAPPRQIHPLLSIDRLYRLPWIIGSQPKSPQWAPDGRRLAFLWNDEGTNFYDVWVTDLDGAQPLRVTTMPRPPASAEPGMDIDRLSQVDQAERDPGVSAVIWAPDARHLIFNFHGRLFQVLPGQAPQPLTEAGPVAADAAAAPRGRQIAYLCDGALWVLRWRGAAPTATRIYAPADHGIEVESFSWSADGTRLAFVEADARAVPVRGIPDYLAAETRLVPVKRPFPGEPAESRRVGVIAAAGGAVQWAELGGDPQDPLFGVNWSPDGRRLLVDKSDLYIKDRRLLLVDAATGSSSLLHREVDPLNVTAEWWSDWAPDSRGVYFISDRDNDYHVYYAALAGGEVKRITAGDWAVFSATLSPRAHALFVVTNQGRPEERQLYRVPLTGGPPLRVTAAAGTHLALPSPDGRHIADLFSNDVTPPDLYLQSAVPAPGAAAAAAAAAGGQLAAGAVRRVTHSPLPEFDRYRWVAAKYVTFNNVDDGTLLHARLTLPPDFDPLKHYPAILGSVYSNTVHNEWGGRIYHPTWGIDQFLAQQGYVIMNVDISGSSGYGKRFRQRIREDYGGVDVEDLYSGVRYLVGQGYVDAHRVGIWGSSYGGLLATTSLFAKPGVYQAGVAGAPATSLFHAQTGEMRTMMAPQDHQVEYAKASAFLKSGGLAGHLLIIHGMRDDTVLFKDSVTLQQRLILQGKNVDFVMLPNAPHGWDTEGLAQTRFAYHKLYEYFDRYLGAADAGGTQ
jgi:dipeptidyl-peptidase-4